MRRDRLQPLQRLLLGVVDRAVHPRRQHLHVSLQRAERRAQVVTEDLQRLVLGQRRLLQLLHPPLERGAGLAVALPLERDRRLVRERRQQPLLPLRHRTLVRPEHRQKPDHDAVHDDRHRHGASALLRIEEPRQPHRELLVERIVESLHRLGREAARGADAQLPLRGRYEQHRLRRAEQLRRPLDGDLQDLIERHGVRQRACGRGQSREHSRRSRILDHDRSPSVSISIPAGPIFIGTGGNGCAVPRAFTIRILRCGGSCAKSTSSARIASATELRRWSG